MNVLITIRRYKRGGAAHVRTRSFPPLAFIQRQANSKIPDREQWQEGLLQRKALEGISTYSTPIGSGTTTGGTWLRHFSARLRFSEPLANNDYFRRPFRFCFMMTA